MTFERVLSAIPKELLDFPLRTRKSKLIELLSQKREPIRIADLTREYLKKYGYDGHKVSGISSFLGYSLTTLEEFDLLTFNDNLEALLTEKGREFASITPGRSIIPLQVVHGKIPVGKLDLLLYLLENGRSPSEEVQDAIQISFSGIIKTANLHPNLIKSYKQRGQEIQYKLYAKGVRTAQEIKDFQENLKNLRLRKREVISTRFKQILRAANKASPTGYLSELLGFQYVFVEGSGREGLVLVTEKDQTFIGEPERSGRFELESGKGLDRRIRKAAKSIDGTSPFYTISSQTKPRGGSVAVGIQIYSLVAMAR